MLPTGNQPLDKGAAELLFYVRRFCRVYEHNPVLVEEPSITFDD
jgi:hypothetical protein